MTGKTIFCNAGFEAVEAALKTAMLATGKAGVIAFDGAYHGLGYGTLNVTHREHFRAPFRSQLAEFGCFLPFPSEAAQLGALEDSMRRVFRQTRVGAVLVEPIQVRAGVKLPPADLLPTIRGLCDEFGALFILDEIYTGFGRTGRWFACEHSGVIPDIVCLGKGLTGGFPLSACVGRAEVMDAAWPPATGDPIHTSTFLGHPVGCAMALAQISEITRLGLVAQSARIGRFLSEGLSQLPPVSSLPLKVRSIGLLAGIEVSRSDGSPAPEAAFRIVKQLLRRGIIVLPDGDNGNVLSLTPPLTVTQRQLDAALNVFADVLAKN
jgi:4-aminobutyrate aminotransferase-like enzyme